MSLYKELSNDSNDISQIVGIQFCILSAEQIVARSVVEITKTDTYNGNEPYANGLFDARMGVIDHNKVCQTCEQRNNFCPGHFGHITLARPMFYTQFFPIVKNLLKCVCYNCSGILVNTESADIQQLLTKKISRQKRFEAIFRFSIKEKKCRHCGSVQPSLSKEGMFKIVQEWKESKSKNAAPVEDKKILAADDVLKIFRRITDKDSEILGFHKKYNRPEDLICTVFPVPPPAVRPSVRNDTGQRSEDDLSHKLAQVVKYNNMLAKKIEKEDSQVDTWSMLLQYEMATLIDNTQPGIPPSQQRTGRPIRSLIERLKGKEGRIRGNLMGKRVDFSARSVITPDPNISIDELGVPIKIAMNLTMPEVVNKWNLVKMARLVRSGPDHYPGAKYVRKTANGQERTIRLKGADRDVIADALGLGDVVERHLEDGDYVLFNRQPSLHRSSMMAHRVRVMPYNTFRLNVMVTPSFNADFDGDEMNMHVAQSLQSHEELLQLAAVPTQIISPRECKPIISVVQDIVLGLYRMTKDRVLLTRKQYFNLLAPNPRCLGDTRDPLGRGGMWTGHQLLSSIIPNKISVFMGNSQYDEEKKNDQHFIKIACGEVNQGIFDKDVYQSRTHGIIHSIYNEYGPDETRVFFDNTQQLICNWLVMDGFSVGISDLSISASTLQQFDVEISKMKTTVYDLIKNIHTGKYENNSKKNNMEDFEKQVNDKLNQAVKEVGKKGLDTIDENNNRLINMIKSKSKGQVINVSQMIGCLGQQNVDGRRIPYGFDSRTLPHYAKYDDGPEARGFVESSFIRGLTPQEFFFAAMGGREGLIDTAVQSVTGDTRVIVIENGRSKDVAIGEWIDDHLASHQTTGKIKFYPEKNMELLELPAGSVFIPTCNADGEVTWGELTHVTRHDPGTRLFKFATESGREVIVADSKSMLVWNPDQQKLVEFESKDVCIGMSVPVTAKLPKPPMVNSVVRMDEYLPRTEYIYGSDFHLATKLTKEAQGDNFFIPKGWWNENNGSRFVLPYSKKALLTRALSGRSNIENIKEGCVYPYQATRCHGHMPADFELNFENGIFIGLYLADGHTCVKGGVVGITKNDKIIQEWSKEWFEKHGFKTRLAQRTSDIGVSYTMVAHSLLLVRFLDQFVGQGSNEKHLPDVAFTAPPEFIRGVLNGYMSGDGTIYKGHGVSCSSTSQRLSEGISMLFSMFGIYGKIKTIYRDGNNLGTTNIKPLYRLTISAKYWNNVSEVLKDMVHQEKKERLLSMPKACDTHVQYNTSNNDVVLDPIVSIEVMGVEHYPKLYDVTVPSTLNFALRNGLQVRDTSETGYLQRKLVKAMEDCKVGFDLSVRNAAGSIVQFLYGDDGMDASKVETQKLHYIDMQPGDIRREYLIESTEDLEHVLTAAAVKEAKGTEAAWLPKATKMYEQIVKDRDFVIAHIFKFKVESNVLYPISLARTITIAKGRMGQGPIGGSDLQPAYVLAKLEELTRSLSVNPTIPGAGMQLFHILLRAYLHPKVLICRHRLTRAAFDEVIERVRTKFYESLAHPSEMVGVIAAQSLGEPATQLSMWSGAKLMVATDRGVVYDGPIGSFIDKMLEAKENKSKVVDLGHGSVVFDPEEDYYVVGVSNEEKTSWRRILQVSRHPANGGMVRIHTASGKTTCCTLSHSFLKRVERGIEPVKGSDLKIGDRVPVAKFIPCADHGIHTVQIGEKDHVLDKDLGWLCGAYVADGHINGTQVSISKVIPEYQDNLRKIFKDKFDLTMKQYASMGSGTLQGWDMSKYPKMDNHVSSKTLADFLHSSFNTGSYRKRLPPWVFSAPQEFVAGMICGYFDGDGHVNSDLGKQMIRSASVSEELTEDFILLLTRVGIFASKCRERHFKEVGRNDLFTVQISRKYARHFKEKVGPMVVPSKAESLDKVIEYVERDDKHSSQEMIDQIPELGEVIASIGKTLELDGQSRLYGRWTKKDAIGRETLKKYLPIFELGLQDKVDRDRVQHEEATRLWSQIKARLDEFMTTDAAFMKKLGPDGERQVNKRAVMELEEALMVPLMNACTTYLGGKYIGNGNASTYRKKQRIQAVTLDVYLTDLAKGIEEARATALAAASDVRDDKLPVLRQALDADVIWDEITEIEWLPDPGEMVYDLTVPGNDSFMVDCGILVHNTLNTFHLAGVSSASKTVRGVPRLKELLSVSKNMKTPNMRIHFVDAIKYNTDACLKEMNDIRIVRFKDIVRSSQIYFDPMRKLEIDQDWLVEHEEESSLVTPWVLRLEYDPAELEKFNLHLTRDVNPFLEKQYGNLIRFYSSDDNHVIPVTRIHLQMGTQNESDLLTDLKALEHTIMEKLILKGVEGVEHVTINKEKRKIWDPLTSQFVEKEESVVYTDGTNFQRILARENVASELVYTNNVIEIYEHLGVEAARQALFNEIMIVLEAVTVNYRHIALLVDYQTNKGTLMSIDRHGINRGDIGPLAKCSFEESTDKLIKAGVFAEYDKINGVSANIMLGQITPAGTGDVTLIMDEDKLPLRPSAAPAHPNLEPTQTGCDFEFDFKVPTPANF